MSEESFAAEFAEFFPHGNADQISRYLFSLFDAADDLRKHEIDLEKEEDSKIDPENSSDSHNISVRVDSKKQGKFQLYLFHDLSKAAVLKLTKVDFIEYMEALAWANHGCTAQTLNKRVKDWQINLFDGFGYEEYKPYIKNGHVDDSKDRC